MTLEEKVGQILMVHVNGEEANEDAKTLIQDLHIGGFIYYNWSNGLHSPDQVQKLSTGLQQLAMVSQRPIPLLISTDQEGGVITRLTKGFTVFPGNKALGMTGNPELAKESAFAMGQEMLAVGINMNHSPVVDVNNNPRNPLIGIRSFGENAETVISFGYNAIQGYHQAGVITVLKHFPGHGDVEIDSHELLPSLHKSKEQLWKMELLPFSELAQETDTIMTAHIMVPALDPIHCATLSPTILGLLRKEIGFNGVIISDSLVMEGLLKNCASIDDAAVRAFNAGCDIVLLGGKQLIGERVGFELKVPDIERIQKTLVAAVENNTISMERLNQSVGRILKLKEKIPSPTTHLNKTSTHLATHRELSSQIANLALRVVKSKTLSSLKEGNYAVIGPELVAGNIKSTPFFSKNPSSFFFNDLNPSEADIQDARECAKNAEALVCFSYNAWRNKNQTALFQAMLDLNKPVYLIALRDSLDVTLFPDADLILATFSPTTPSIDAAYEQLIELQAKDTAPAEEYSVSPHTP